MVAVVQSGRAVDPFMRGCAREVWLLCCLNDIDLTVMHIAGNQKQAADILSRAHLGHTVFAALEELQRVK